MNVADHDHHDHPHDPQHHNQGDLVDLPYPLAIIAGDSDRKFGHASILSVLSYDHNIL